MLAEKYTNTQPENIEDVIMQAISAIGSIHGPHELVIQQMIKDFEKKFNTKEYMGSWRKELRTIEGLLEEGCVIDHEFVKNLCYKPILCCSMHWRYNDLNLLLRS